MTLRVSTVEHHAIKDLMPWASNPRVHDPEQLRLLEKSIEHHGLVALPIVQKGTLRILAGHGRVEAMLNMGLGNTVIPCIVLDCSTEDAEAYTVADNRIGDLSMWGMLDLRDILGELDNGAYDMEFTGYTEDELKKIFGTLAPAVEPLADVDPEEEEEPLILEAWIYKGRVEVKNPAAKKPGKIEPLLAAAITSALGMGA